MNVLTIHLERKSQAYQCGTLVYREASTVGTLLWTTSWQGAKVSVEFVPGEGATQAIIHAGHALLVEAVVQAVAERLDARALFS